MSSLMGTQVAYPLLYLGGFNPWASLPAFALTLLSVVYLLVRPMWSVHVHLREAKTALIRSTDAQIRRWRTEHPGQNLPDGAWLQISFLLQFRTQAMALSEWLFNLGLALR